MRICIVSNTHLPRFRARLPRALAAIACEAPDAILHCGDLTTPEALDAFAQIAPIDAVAGNNDGDAIVRRYGRRKVATIAGLRIGMIHGDGAKGTTLGRALAAFAAADVDVIAFGHSHIPYLATHDGIWVVNPGSITDKRREPRYSFAIVDPAAEPPVRLVFFD